MLDLQQRDLVPRNNEAVALLESIPGEAVKLSVVKVIGDGVVQGLDHAGLKVVVEDLNVDLYPEQLLSMNFIIV